MIGVLTQKNSFRWKKTVDRRRQAVPHARHGADYVGPGAQMRHLAQIFRRVRLGLDRVGVRIIDPADRCLAASITGSVISFRNVCLRSKRVPLENIDAIFLLLQINNLYH